MLAPLPTLVGTWEDAALSSPLSFLVLCDTLTPHSLPSATLWLCSPRRLWIFPILDILLSVIQSGTLCIWFPSHSMCLKTPTMAQAKPYFLPGCIMFHLVHRLHVVWSMSAHSHCSLWLWCNQKHAAGLVQVPCSSSSTDTWVWDSWETRSFWLHGQPK